jgi:hypothetical protein
MKQLTKYINERLVLSKTRASVEYGYIDEMHTGPVKTDEIFNVLNDRYPEMFDEMRIMKTGNIKMGKITPEYQISKGIYNDSEFVFYIYDNYYLIRRVIPNAYGSTPAKFIELKTLEETLNKFDALLTKRGYKLPK